MNATVACRFRDGAIRRQAVTGTAVSAGLCSSRALPYIRKLGLGGCPPETCYVDNIESYSTNEVAINWNAALAWTAAFLDDLGQSRLPNAAH